jgi:hypothetical protein
MENKIEILIKQNRMLMQQLLRISEDLELAQEKIAKLEKSECTGSLKTKNPHMKILNRI